MSAHTFLRKGSHTALLAFALGMSLTLWFGAPRGFGQIPTGTILGAVKDSSGASVPGATITIRNVDTAQTRTIVTGDDGAYRIPALPVGHYEVKAEHAGFKSETRAGITLDVSQEAVINVTLQVGATSQQVEVTGEAPIVNTTDSSLGGLVNNNRIEDLPLNGRNYMDLSLLQAGVTQHENMGGSPGMQGTWFSSNGAPTRSNYMTLDGASLVNQFGGVSASFSGTTLGVDGIQEYKIITNTFGAQYGMTMGSQVVMVSKGGTNQFHGDVFDYLRNSVLDARNWFDYGYLMGGPRLPDFQRNNFGGSFGGPIKKDKTFFYGVYEGLREKQGFTAIDNVLPAACHQLVNPNTNNSTLSNPGACDPSLTATTVVPQVIQPFLALYPSPNLPNNLFTFATANRVRDDYGQMRVDEILSASDSFFVRYTIDNGTDDSASPGSFSASSGNAFPQIRGLGDSRNQYLSLVENHIFSPTLLNTVRLSFSRTKFSVVDIYQQASLSGPPYSYLPGVGMGALDFNDGSVTSQGPDSTQGPPPTDDTQNIYTFSDDIDYTRGKHALKFGVLVNRFNQGEQARLLQTGDLAFDNIAKFMQGLPKTESALTPGSNLNRDFIYNTLGFYVQDDWRTTSRLTMNLGLRYEFMTTPWELSGREGALRNFATDKPAAITPGPVMDNRTHLNFSPRLGFAYDVTGKGTTSIRGGVGLYYDVGNIGGALLQETLGIPPFSSNSSDKFPSNSTAVLTLPFVFPAAVAGKSLHTMDYNLSQPHLLQYSLTFEQQLPADVGLTVSYVGTRGLALFNEKEANPTIPTAVGPGTLRGLPILYWATTVPQCAKAVPTCRLNPNWAQATMVTSAGDSWYNGLQVSAVKRLSKGLEFQSSYTWAQALDTTSGQLVNADCVSAGADRGVNPAYPLWDKGPSCFDVTNNWRFNLLYHFRNISSDNIAAKFLLNGWWVGNIVSLQSGYPFTPVLNANRSNSAVGGGGLPDSVDYGTSSQSATFPCSGTAPLIPNGPACVNGEATYNFIPFNQSRVTLGNPQEWFNPLMFALQPMVPCPGNSTLTCGTLGTAGRDSLRGPGLTDWDFSLVKDTPISFPHEGTNVEFRAEVFNILNHPNFGMPNPVIYDGSTSDIGSYSEAPLPTAGQITNTATTSRQIQFALKFVF